jgi:hypothetical protein
MPTRQEIFSQFHEIVDLTIAYDVNLARFISDRLMPPLQVDDAQATHADTATRQGEMPLVIGSTMNQAIRHGA